MISYRVQTMKCVRNELLLFSFQKLILSIIPESEHQMILDEPENNRPSQTRWKHWLSI